MDNCFFGTVNGGNSTSSLVPGSQFPARISNQGGTLVSQLHGKGYEDAYRGASFSAATQAVATTTVGLATTYTGLVLSNPVGSAVNLVLNRASMMQSIIQSAQPEAYALAVGFNSSTNVTHTTPLVTRSNKVGVSNSATGLADISATLPTAPFYHTFLHNTSSATVNGNGTVVDLEGGIILIPGAYCLFVTPGQASVAGAWFSFMWSEVAV